MNLNKDLIKSMSFGLNEQLLMLSMMVQVVRAVSLGAKTEMKEFL